MSRIDLLTAQMRQRAVRRVSIQADQRMKLFGEGERFLGEGACLTSQAIGEILTPIAPGPLDGTPVTFCYNGRDGQFEIAVAPDNAGFEVRAFSFAPIPKVTMPGASPQKTVVVDTPVQNAPLQTQNAFEPLSPTAPLPAPEWFYCAGEEQTGPVPAAQIKTLIRAGQIKGDTMMWSEGMADWQSASQTEFKALLPALPSALAPATDAFGNPLNVAPIGDSQDAWFYRSATGQTVPLEPV